MNLKNSPWSSNRFLNTPSNCKDLQPQMSEIPAKTAVSKHLLFVCSLCSWRTKPLWHKAQFLQSESELHLQPFIPPCPEFFSSPAHQFLKVSVKIPNFLPLAALNFSKPSLLQCWTPTAPASRGFIILTTIHFCQSKCFEPPGFRSSGVWFLAELFCFKHLPQLLLRCLHPSGCNSRARGTSRAVH